MVLKGTGETPADAMDDRDLLMDWAGVTAETEQADRRHPSSTDSLVVESLYCWPIVD